MASSVLTSSAACARAVGLPRTGRASRTAAVRAVVRAATPRRAPERGRGRTSPAGGRTSAERTAACRCSGCDLSVTWRSRVRAASCRWRRRRGRGRAARRPRRTARRAAHDVGELLLQGGRGGFLGGVAGGVEDRGDRDVLVGYWPSPRTSQPAWVSTEPISPARPSTSVALSTVTGAKTGPAGAVAVGTAVVGGVLALVAAALLEVGTGVLAADCSAGRWKDQKPSSTRATTTTATRAATRPARAAAALLPGVGGMGVMPWRRSSRRRTASTACRSARLAARPPMTPVSPLPASVRRPSGPCPGPRRAAGWRGGRRRTAAGARGWSGCGPRAGPPRPGWRRGGRRPAARAVVDRQRRRGGAPVATGGEGTGPAGGAPLRAVVGRQRRRGRAPPALGASGPELGPGVGVGGARAGGPGRQAVVPGARPAGPGAGWASRGRARPWPAPREGVDGGAGTTRARPAGARAAVGPRPTGGAAGGQAPGGRWRRGGRAPGDGGGVVGPATGCCAVGGAVGRGGGRRDVGPRPTGGAVSRGPTAGIPVT